MDITGVLYSAARTLSPGRLIFLGLQEKHHHDVNNTTKDNATQMSLTELLRRFLYNLGDSKLCQACHTKAKHQLTKCPEERITTLDELAGLRHTRTLVACSPIILDENQ